MATTDQVNKMINVIRETKDSHFQISEEKDETVIVKLNGNVVYVGINKGNETWVVRYAKMLFQ
jgi:hypothetical protein